MGHNKRRPKNPKNNVDAPDMEAEGSTQDTADSFEAEQVEIKVKSSAKSHQANTDETVNTEAQNDRGEELHADANGEQTQDKIHLEFYGSDLIRQKAPKVMELADTVAEEWMQDGQFEGLPLGSPLAQVAAAKALRKAKDVEKKLEEKGVFAMAKMGMDYVKSQMEKRNQNVSRKQD